MTMQYMQQHAAADPDVVGRTKDLLKKGYARLTGYECKQHGYEWFGGDPGHEALTAYGLMQFRDMQKVYDVDPAMIDRTAEWLLARRDGKGGFQRNPKALDSFGQAPADVTDAYITWALSESGQSGIDAEVKHAIELGQKSDDPYVLALAASTAVERQPEGRRPQAARKTRQEPSRRRAPRQPARLDHPQRRAVAPSRNHGVGRAGLVEVARVRGPCQQGRRVDRRPHGKVAADSDRPRRRFSR